MPGDKRGQNMGSSLAWEIANLARKRRPTRGEKECLRSPFSMSTLDQVACSAARNEAGEKVLYHFDRRWFCHVALLNARVSMLSGRTLPWQSLVHPRCGRRS
jgi:hypothetical protein